jgi:hypothetical protein
MKRLITIVVMLILIVSCSRTMHKKRKGCKGKGGWYNNRNLSSIVDSIQKHKEMISYQHFIVSYPHLYV